MPRQARLDAPGTIHHVIIRGIEKGDIVEDDGDRDNFVARMGKISKETDTVIYAWALLTNHAHILLRSSSVGLSKYMRRFLTGYAVSYNLKHRRHGHLFQNRYKSIVCEEEPYLMELVRYIHLNPLRATIVADMAALRKYRWSGHGVLMGEYANDWQVTAEILGRFGKSKKSARENYEKFVSDGIVQGKRNDLVGGGLIRSLGGWSAVKTLKQEGENSQRDDRILGSSEFVEQLLKEAEHGLKSQFKADRPYFDIDEYISKKSREENVNLEELRGGSRRRAVSSLRKIIANKLVVIYGVPMAEVARKLGITTSGVSRLLTT